MSEVDGFARSELFHQRPVWQHLAALAGGGVFAGLVYLALLLGFVEGGLGAATAGGTAAVRTRRSAVVVVCVAAGGYYGFCTTRALGGLLLNVLMVPLSATVTPLVVGLALGRLPAITVSPARSLPFIAELALVVLPGVAVTLVVLALWGWFAFSSPEESEQWAHTYLPPRYHGSVRADASTADDHDEREKPSGDGSNEMRKPTGDESDEQKKPRGM